MTAVEIAREPFRIFFPLALLAGVIGVALWPLHLWGWVSWYPGQIHARMMAFGFFGGFILGFLGTAMPRMLSAPHLRVPELFGLVAVYAVMVTMLALGKLAAGDALFAILLLAFLTLFGARFPRRQDTPPPGFVLVALSFLSAVAGAILALLSDWREVSPRLAQFQHLLSYQGFVLFPILGIAPFILPRFFGLRSAHDFPEMLSPTPVWKRKAALALAAGILIVVSFFVEAAGWHRAAYSVRFATATIYIALELPIHRAPRAANPLGASIRAAILSILAGFLCVALFPEFRVALLHLTLVGGFALITFVVATRVIFGHSGNLEQLKKPNRWLWIAVGMMLFAMATRISGDFWPSIMGTHYTYGAILWIAGVLLWAVKVLPKIFVIEPE